MRDICDVIKRIKAQIPNDDKVLMYTLAHREIDTLSNKALYIAPESQSNLWIHLSNILFNNLGVPDTEWKLEVLKIMRGDK